MLIRTQVFFFGVFFFAWLLRWVFHSCSRTSPLWDAPRFMAWHQSICSRNISLVRRSTLRWVIKDFLETNLGSIIGHNLIPYHRSFHCCLAKNVHFLLFNDSTWFLSLLLPSRWGEIIYCTATLKSKGTYRGYSEKQILVLIETNILGLCLHRVHIRNSGVQEQQMFHFCFSSYVIVLSLFVYSFSCNPNSKFYNLTSS